MSRKPSTNPSVNSKNAIPSGKVKASGKSKKKTRVVRTLAEREELVAKYYELKEKTKASNEVLASELGISPSRLYALMKEYPKTASISSEENDVSPKSDTAVVSNAAKAESNLAAEEITQTTEENNLHVDEVIQNAVESSETAEDNVHNEDEKLPVNWTLTDILNNLAQAAQAIVNTLNDMEEKENG